MCGICGIISHYGDPHGDTAHGEADGGLSLDELWHFLYIIDGSDLAACRPEKKSTASPDAAPEISGGGALPGDAGTPFSRAYLGGEAALTDLYRRVRNLKQDAPFHEIFSSRDIQGNMSDICRGLCNFLEKETRAAREAAGSLTPEESDILHRRLEILRDIHWCLETEVLETVHHIHGLMHRSAAPESVVRIFHRINAVFASIDRLEVRGRDSAGISLLFILDNGDYDAFTHTLDKANFLDQFSERQKNALLENQAVCVRRGPDAVSVCFVYKVAAEIGSLGDNVTFLRQQVKKDPVLQAMVNFPHRYFTAFSHTRWASVGGISVPNCHPVDNRIFQGSAGRPGDASGEETGIIHVCLNGDIDNYLDLKKNHERDGREIHPDITTDTKLIPLEVERHMRDGKDTAEAFRLAVQGFDGSHAVCMHTDLAPGKLFLAQRGSGQAIFVGLANGHYMAASELYGLIGETSRYLKLDGETVIETADGTTQGQIFILDQQSGGGLSGITAMRYDGVPVTLTEKDIHETDITSRDIDRQGFPHYFLKEISEAPASVEKTLRNRWRITGTDSSDVPCETSVRRELFIGEEIVPADITREIASGAIRRIYFTGQGTAGIAAKACAAAAEYYLNDPARIIKALKASELSGFQLGDGADSMTDCLVVAISQSGTTTDTNRTVDMVREKGARTLAIVNRRDSDLSFKVDGVMYTSSGRDLEMSVASTKAFYSQIVAGTLLGLHLAAAAGRRDQRFISHEIGNLLELPDKMRRTLHLRERLKESAEEHAVSRTYWAAVGSGPNKIAADEIRIKLSELCYKTISTDYVEDKKHIDLSSEPLILVCAAGTRETVLGDIIKDTAIFRAHKAVPIVFTDRGETRFDPYAADVFHLPRLPEHLAPILNTLAGHLWGYHAALAIHDNSRRLFAFRESVREMIAATEASGGDLYELVLEKDFREAMLRFYGKLRDLRIQGRLPDCIGLNLLTELTILLKYLSGRLPLPDFEADFGVKGTAANLLATLFDRLNLAINQMARPVDAIKHQAKTVTVGTSRLAESLEGILFDAVRANGFTPSRLTPHNVMMLKNFQHIVSEILGTTVYRIDGLNLLGEPTDRTRITVLDQSGTSAGMISRVSRDNHLRGSKRLIVKEGNAYIGMGRRDGRSLLMIPVMSETAEAAAAIDHILLLHINFRDPIPVPVKARALGGKLSKIRGYVQENSLAWDDTCLDLVETRELFGISAEKKQLQGLSSSFSGLF